MEWQGKAINQVEFTGKPSENCQSPGSDDDEDGDNAERGRAQGQRLKGGRRKGERGAACSSKHIKCGILNAKLSTTTTTTTRRIGCRIVVAPSCCRQTLDGDTLRVIELSEMLSPSPSPIANAVAIAIVVAVVSV